MSANVTWIGTTQLFESRLPTFGTGDRFTATRVFEGPYAACWSALPTKGDAATIAVPGTSDSVNVWVESATLAGEDGNRGILTVTYAGVLDDATLPPDEWALRRDQLETSLEKHAAYSALFAGALGENRLRAIEALLKGEATYFDTETMAEEEAGWITDNTAPDYDADVHEIYRLRAAGKHVFALFPPSLTRVVYYADYPASASDDGGYIDTPSVPTGLLLPTGIQWLRVGDELDWNGSYWRLTSAWKGAPEWSSFIYPS